MNTFLHIFVNAFYSNGKGISGGDKRIIEFLKIWNKTDENREIRLYSPRKLYNLIDDKNIDKIGFYDTTEPKLPSNAKKQIVDVPDDLFVTFQIIFYNSPEDAVFKALGIE